MPCLRPGGCHGRRRLAHPGRKLDYFGLTRLPARVNKGPGLSALWPCLHRFFCPTGPSSSGLVLARTVPCKCQPTHEGVGGRQRSCCPRPQRRQRALPAWSVLPVTVLASRLPLAQHLSASRSGGLGPPSILQAGTCCSSLQPPRASQRAPPCRPPLAVSVADRTQEKPPPVPRPEGHCGEARRAARLPLARACLRHRDRPSPPHTFLTRRLPPPQGLSCMRYRAPHDRRHPGVCPCAPGGLGGPCRVPVHERIPHRASSKTPGLRRPKSERGASRGKPGWIPTSDTAQRLPAGPSV